MAVPRKLKPLVQYLESLEGPADLAQLEQLLGETEVTRADLSAHCRFKDDCYARNLVSKSEHYELLLICWRSGQASSIHDHLGSACAFKVIHGSAVETNFAVTSGTKVIPNRSKTFEEGEICSAPSEGYIHQMVNDQPAGSDLITIHIYSPPLNMNTFELDESAPEAVRYGARYLRV